MKHHLLGLAAAILTFIVGWSIATVVLKHASESVVLPPVAMPSDFSAAWTILLAKQNHPLKEIEEGPEKAQLQMAIETLRVTKNQMVHPTLFSQLSTSLGEPRFVLIEEAPIFNIPGDSRLSDERL